MSEAEKLFHLYLISDSTGETINAVAKAVCARFEGARAIEHSYGLIRSSKQLERALKAIESAAGPGFVQHCSTRIVYPSGRGLPRL